MFKAAPQVMVFVILFLIPAQYHNKVCNAPIKSLEDSMLVSFCASLRHERRCVQGCTCSKAQQWHRFIKEYVLKKKKKADTLNSNMSNVNEHPSIYCSIKNYVFLELAKSFWCLNASKPSVTIIFFSKC